jgi:hypothetical protein
VDKLVTGLGDTPGNGGVSLDSAIARSFTATDTGTTSKYFVGVRAWLGGFMEETLAGARSYGLFCYRRNLGGR